MKKLVIGLCLVLISLCALAQPYKGAVGARLGFAAGITGKFFFTQRDVIETMATYQWIEHGFGITGLYERHNYSALRSNNVAVFYGVGIHLAYYTGGYYKNREQILYVEDTYNIGVDSILGIDFHEPGTALNWSIDVKPLFDFVNPGFRFWDGSVSIRYAFQ